MGPAGLSWNQLTFGSTFGTAAKLTPGLWPDLDLGELGLHHEGDPGSSPQTAPLGVILIFGHHVFPGQVPGPLVGKRLTPTSVHSGTFSAATPGD